MILANKQINKIIILYTCLITYLYVYDETIISSKSIISKMIKS